MSSNAAVARQLVVCPLSTEQLVDKTLVFIEYLSDTKFYAYQALFARRVVSSIINRDGATITALWARQSGKTETVANVCIGLAIILPALAREFPDDPRLMPFADGFMVGIYAPIDHQAKISFTRMRNLVNSEHGVEILSDPDIDVELVTNRSDTLGFSNGSRVMAKSASPETQIEGDTHHLVICEEAQRLSRQKVDKEISPMLASTNGTCVKIGTAWHSRGGFHISIQQNIEEHRSGGPRSHFEFDYKIVIREKRARYEEEVREHGVGNPFHLNYEKFIEGEIKKLGGTDSEEFKMNYCCQWQESRIIAVSPRKFKEARLLNVEAGRSTRGFQVAGLDIGKTIDATVLTVGFVDMQHPIVNKYFLPGADEDRQFFYNKTILDWLEIYGDFTGGEGQYQQLVDYLSMTNVKVLCVDATTVGNPVCEQLDAMLGGSITVVPVVFSLVSKHNLYKYYLTELHAGRVKYAAGPNTQQRIEYKKFVHEHEILDKVAHGNYVTCEAPEGEHDDYPDSASLMCWAEKVAASVMLPEIVVDDYDKFWNGGNGGGNNQQQRLGRQHRYYSRRR